MFFKLKRFAVFLKIISNVTSNSKVKVSAGGMWKKQWEFKAALERTLPERFA